MTGEAVEVHASQIQLNNLRAEGYGLQLREQTAEIKTVGVYHFPAGRLQAETMTVATTAWSARGDDLVVQADAKGEPQFTGEFNFRSDLSRTLAALRPPGEPSKVKVRGQATGTALIGLQDGATDVDYQGEVTGLLISLPPPAVATGGRRASPSRSPPAPQTLWMERQLHYVGRCRYDHRHDALIWEQSNVKGSGIEVASSGRIDQLTTAPIADLKGEAKYNLAAISHRLFSGSPAAIQLLGEETSPFVLRGPLFAPPASAGPPTDGTAARLTSTGAPASPPPLVVSPELYAAAGMQWKSASGYGLVLGARPLGSGTASRHAEYRAVGCGSRRWTLAAGAPAVSQRRAAGARAEQRPGARRRAGHSRCVPTVVEVRRPAAGRRHGRRRPAVRSAERARGVSHR